MEKGTVKKVLKKLQRKYLQMRNDCVWFFYQEELPEEINDKQK